MVWSSIVTLKMATQAAFTCSLDTHSIPGTTPDVKWLLTTV